MLTHVHSRTPLDDLLNCVKNAGLLPLPSLFFYSDKLGKIRENVIRVDKEFLVGGGGHTENHLQWPYNLTVLCMQD